MALFYLAQRSMDDINCNLCSDENDNHGALELCSYCDVFSHL